MKAIYKKEIRNYMTSMIGYVFMAFILAIVGLYFSAVNISSGSPQIGYSLSSSTFAFLICVPILTMRVIAEERKQKTDQLLLTTPVRIGEIITGKYLALITIFFIPLVVISLYPLILRKFGTVSMGMSYTSILGFFLLGCAEIAVGLFLSSVTESQMIAAILSFAILFICYLSDGIGSLFPHTAKSSFAVFIVLIFCVCLWIGSMIKNTIITGIFTVVAEGALVITYIVKSSLFEGSIQKFFNIFNFTNHFNNFTKGILDLNGIVYFLSVIVICLFLTDQAISKRRWN